jgi:predicted  nucleic acid-binding Zn-ribbon protein
MHALVATRAAHEAAAMSQQIAASTQEMTASTQEVASTTGDLTERANQAEKQLYSGAVTAPRELQALQDDVASIRRRIGQIEDAELEIMELTEPVGRAELWPSASG